MFFEFISNFLQALWHTWLRSISHFPHLQKVIHCLCIDSISMCNWFYSNDTRILCHIVFFNKRRNEERKKDFIGISKIVLFIFDGYSFGKWRSIRNSIALLFSARKTHTPSSLQNGASMQHIIQNESNMAYSGTLCLLLYFCKFELGQKKN